MSKKMPDYAVGYGKPPLHSRFRKGISGNPQGGRRHRQMLGAVLQEALDQPAAGEGARRSARHQPTRREAIIAGLVEKSAAGDLPATRLLLELDLKTELAAGPAPHEEDDEDPREFLKRELTRIRARMEANGEIEPERKPSTSDEPGPPKA